MASVLQYMYRSVRYTKEENAAYYKIRARHAAFHKKSLFAGAFPVFVAATISRAVLAIIDAISNQVDVQIGLNFVYALFIAQVLGYVVIFSIPSSSPLFRYYFHIATENTAFAWKQVMVLIIMDKLILVDPLGFSFAAFFAMTMCTCLLVVGSNAFHMFVMKTDEETYLKIKLFEAEIFSLGLAYTFNVLVIAMGCGVSYLSVLDYTDSEGDDGGSSSNTVCDNLGFLYAVVLTWLLIKLQHSGVMGASESALEEAEKALEIEEAEFEAELEAEMQGEKLAESEGSAGDVEATTAEPPIDNNASISMSGASSSAESTKVDVGPEMDSCSEWCVSMSGALTRYCTPVDAVLCAWDPERSATVSLGMLMFTFLGMYVGCAWYTYSFVAFGFLETGNSIPVLGALVFAVVVTSVGTHVMVLFTVAVEMDERAGKAKKLTGQRMRRVQIMLMALRLVVGWCWEEVIGSAVDLIFPHQSSILFQWVRVLIKVAVSVAVFFIGLEIERRTGVLTTTKLEALRNSVIERTGSVELHHQTATHEVANETVTISPLAPAVINDNA